MRFGTLSTRLSHWFQHLAVVCGLACCGSTTQAAEEAPVANGAWAVVTDYCYQCHGNEQSENEGDVNLAQFASPSALAKSPELLARVIEVLELGEMPPAGEPIPAAPERNQLIEELRDSLKKTISLQTEKPRTPLRRMNRMQFNNAVRDLLQLNVDVMSLPEKMMREYGDYFQPASGKMPAVVKVGSRPLGKSQLIEPRLANVETFPQDLRAEHGFDNRGDHLTLSPLLLESFLRISRSIVDSPDFGPQTCGIWDSFFAPPTNVSLQPEVENRLQGFLTCAFRRPVEAAVLSRYSEHALARIEAGESFTDAMKAVTAAAIASPRFLYLFDQAVDNNGGKPVDDFNLASRLSFFLWVSIPDLELLELAAAGNLSDPQILSEQIDRMLLDRRVKRFCDSFPAQWLQLDRIISSAPDRDLFPDFYFAKYNSSMHMMLEPLLLFETVFIENQSITQFLDADFSYRSTRLTSLFYGGPAAGKQNEVTAVQFQRTPITDRRQGGVITNAAVMTMTSGPERTKPITRGAWLATVIFNSPPPPPPANVPPLDEVAPVDEAELTLRERLVMHRQRADCSGCHEKIDPLGFALENYGPTGRWRESYDNGRRVDMQGRLFRKYEFSNVAEFKDALLAEKDRFARAFAAHLLSFALARELSFKDRAAVEQVAWAAAADDYRLQSMLKRVAMCQPFVQSAYQQEMQNDDR